MIRIDRPAEPPALSIVRAIQLEFARVAVANRAKPDLSGYAVVKSALAAMQSNKCCYCEKPQEQPAYRDVEHYRPKTTYWWLTWTWENLLFSCIDCNRQAKGAQFPLTVGDTPLVAEEMPPGNEHPLILDPSHPELQPHKEIQFRALKVQGKERWMPFGLTARGAKTIEVCGLDRPSLIDLYSQHVLYFVRPRVDKVLQAFKAENVPEGFKAWRSTKRAVLDPVRPYSALSRDALVHLMPMSLRREYNLEI